MTPVHLSLKQLLLILDSGEPEDHKESVISTIESVFSVPRETAEDLLRRVLVSLIEGLEKEPHDGRPLSEQLGIRRGKS